MATEPRLTSANPDFPWNAGTVCFFVLDGDEIQYLRFVGDRRDAVQAAWQSFLEARREFGPDMDLDDVDVKLYAVWPGQYRSDLFRVDDINEMAAAIGVKLPDGLA